MERNVTQAKSRINRRNYSRISGSLELPNLVEIQTNSFEWFKNEGIKEVFDEEGLKKHLKENIPSYSSGSSDKMLENDIKSLYYIKRLRKGKTVNSIEKCKAVFVTSNHNLVKNVKEFLNL